MSEEIRDFRQRKVADLIRERRPRTVRIVFRHGLGDALAFWRVCLPALERAFPDVVFLFDTHLGQEALFGVHPQEADLDVRLAFPCAEWDAGDRTKAEKCAVEELGLEGPFPERTGLPGGTRPLVGLHFFSTCIERLCAREEAARAVWEEVGSAGFQPVDTHLRHANANHVPWDWEDVRCDGISASTGHLASLVAACRGFAGVSSGNIHMALSVLPPERILFLRTDFPVCRMTRLPVRELDIRGGRVDRDALRKWLALL